jgi:hypothetical protein
MRVPQWLAVGCLLVAACGAHQHAKSRPPCEDDAGADSAAARICNRAYPSVFEAWNPAQNLDTGPSGAVAPLVESVETTMARHDLIWKGVTAFGLAWDGPYPGAATRFTEASIAAAVALRQRLLAMNPNVILLGEIRYHDAASTYLPADSPWWQRDATGSPVVHSQSSAGDGPHYYLDFTRDDLQAQVAAQCRAVVQSGALDGCMLDWWSKDTPERVAMIQKVRQAIGDDAILVVNVNGSRPVASAPYVNGMYMEGLGASSFPDWTVAASNTEWADANLRVPAFSALDAWAQLPAGRADYAAMRFATAIALIHGNGYVLFADANSLPTPDHLHDWYSFWDRSLGRPSGAGTIESDETRRRDYERGTVVLNPPDRGSVTVRFDEARTRVSNGDVSDAHSLAAGDADLFLR